MPKEGVPRVISFQSSYSRLTFGRGTHQNDIVPSNYDRPDFAGAVGVRNVLGILENQIHVLVVTVQFSPDGASALQFDEYDLAKALLEDFRRNFRH